MDNIEVQPGSSFDSQTKELAVEIEPSNKQSTFQINRDIIETVQPENQPEELRALGITIYNQSTFEEGILKQVDDALRKQEKKSASQASTKVKKNALDRSSTFEKSQENEKEKLIRLGHMTPFGTVIGQQRKPNDLTSFEKYLLEQEKLRNEKLKNSSKKGKSLKTATACNVELKPAPTIRASVSKLCKKKTCNRESDDEYLPEREDNEALKSNSKQQIKAKKRKSNSSDSASWHSDDSNWEYSGDEDGESPKKKRKTVGRVIDDGNVKDYKERISTWSLHHDYDEYEEFEGGCRIPLAIWDKLYNYQRVGVRWMYELRLQRCGGILGDEMGLGKTVQVVAFLAGLAFSNILTRLSNYRGLGPVLLVTPATVMHQWVKEFHKWWPPLRVAILHESGSHIGSRNSLIKSINGSNGVLVTSYTGVVNYSEALLGLDWDYIILDEGHKIRNPDAQATLAVKQFRTCNRFILSGSPMQNNLKELWSLFDFIFPGKLGTLPVFLQQFAVPITQGGYANASQVQVATAYKCAKVLRDTINPYLLRRMKCDVKDHVKLPPKNEQVLFCRLTVEQRKLYQTYLDSGEIKKIMDGRVQIFVGLTNLRKICNHPDLFEEKKEKDNYGSVDSSGKMVVVESLLRIWKEQSHRCLLFSQSRQMLDLLEKFVREQNYTYLRLDGTTGIGSRQPLIEKFNNSPEIFLFLLTTRVGGLGVNLTGANRVIIYDPDWNPSTDTQARERAWRIGQRKDVTVYRLLTSGTIEEKIYHRQIFKQYLTNRVLKDPKQRRFFKSNDLYELFTLKDTDGQCTETEAIFAGTGSEIANNSIQTSSERKDTKDDNEWMLEWKKNREKREAEWKKALENEKRKKELENETAEERRARKKRETEEKKKKKQVKVDGAKVKNVIKVSDFRPGTVDESSDLASSSNQNDYVLQRLFAKTGVLSAMRHDSIIDAGDPDYVLVEQEAEKVAKEAVKELKSSRRSCWNAEAGVPTWTGTNGSVRQPGAENQKPRFGFKKNVTSVISLNRSNDALSEENSNKADHSGSQEISLPGTSKMLGSSDLLSRMQARNRLTGLQEPETNCSNDSLQSVSIEEPLILNSQPAPLEFATGVDYRTIMDNIRSFVAFRGVLPGLVTTTDLLTEFNGKLPPKGAPLFRALLNQLCTFSRNASGEGVWQLKPEFQ